MSWQSLPPLVDRATLIARATVIRLGSTELAGVSVRTILLQPREVLKGTAGSEITVIENACRYFEVREGDEWIAFLAPYATTFSTPYAPVRTTATVDAYVTLGGPESVLTIRAGTLAKAGSLEEMPAQLVRSYEGKPAAHLLADVRAVHPIDGDVRDLFARFGWAPRSIWHLQELTMPPAIGFQNLGLVAPGPGPKVSRTFDEFAQVSSEVGMDLRPYASRPAELVEILLERDWDGNGRFPPLGHAVIVDRRVIGAWVQILPQGDLYSLRQRDAALAATPHDPPPPTPIPNRYPHGVNLARDHGLAPTRALSVKTPSLGGGQTQDPVVIGRIVGSLDVMLDTLAVPAPPAGQPMIVLIWAEDRYFSLEYWAELDLLVNRSFGYAVHPPHRAIELLESIR
jgi:hypothetical protein